LEVFVAPLRDRPDDIGPLVNHFLKRHCARTDTQKIFQTETLVRLKAHTWPGNVRELENIVERLMVNTQGSAVTVAEVDAALKLEPLTSGLNALDEKHESEKKAMIKKAVTGAPSKGKAAENLGISSSNLTYYLKLYNLTS
jgi:DNA-binding NtrC family response regulator